MRRANRGPRKPPFGAVGDILRRGFVARPHPGGIETAQSGRLGTKPDYYVRRRHRGSSLKGSAKSGKARRQGFPKSECFRSRNNRPRLPNRERRLRAPFVAVGGGESNPQTRGASAESVCFEPAKEPESATNRLAERRAASDTVSRAGLFRGRTGCFEPSEAVAVPASARTVLTI